MAEGVEHRSVRWLHLLPVLFTATLLSACEDEDTEPDPIVLSDRDVFAKELAQALCQGATTCCADRALNPPSDGCTTELRNEVFVQLLRADKEHREVFLDDEHRCLDAYEAALEASTCDDLPHPVELPSRCPHIFGEPPDGELDPGSMCEQDYECKAPESGVRRCFKTELSGPGTCTWFIPADEECTVAGSIIEQCPEGEGCSPDEREVLVCGAPRALNEPCGDQASCSVGLRCSALDGDDFTTCVQARIEHEPCDDRHDSCEEPLFCSSAGTCEKLPIIAQCEDGGCATPLELYCQ